MWLTEGGAQAPLFVSVGNVFNNVFNFVMSTSQKIENM
jgi:hypothetical protein